MGGSNRLKLLVAHDYGEEESGGEMGTDVKGSVAWRQMMQAAGKVTYVTLQGAKQRG